VWRRGECRTDRVLKMESFGSAFLSMMMSTTSTCCFERRRRGNAKEGRRKRGATVG
jgi:hypothetical protein